MNTYFFGFHPHFLYISKTSVFRFGIHIPYQRYGTSQSGEGSGDEKVRLKQGWKWCIIPPGGCTVYKGV